MAAPLLVDSFTLAASIEVLRSALAGQRAVYPWCLVAGATLASAALNIAHAPEHPAAQAVAGHPPNRAAAGPGAADARRPLYLGVQGGGQRAGTRYGAGTAAGLADAQPVHP